MSSGDIPKLKAKQVLYKNTDLDQYLSDEMMDKSSVEKLVQNTINPVPNVNYYNSEDSIPITNGEQIIFYAAQSGLIKIYLTDDCIYEYRLESLEDCCWLLWIQNTEIQGSLINPTTGKRQYMQTYCIVESARTEFIPDDTNQNTSYVFITIV